MNLDLAPFFAEYESLVRQVDAVFQKVSGQFPREVTCRQGCSDCCHALFDITLIEALYLNVTIPVSTRSFGSPDVQTRRSE